jgi:hypothetical protein
MYRGFQAVGTTAQIGKQSTNVDVAAIDVGECKSVSARRDRKWEQPSVREDRARYASISRIESLPR